MNNKTTFLSLGYWFSAYSLGMLLHPYKTVRELVRRQTFTPLVLVPFFMWGFMWMVGMVGLRFGWLLLWIIGLEATSRFVNILAFLFWWITCFALFWQVMVGYLWVRFQIIGRGLKF
jgi:hypothetical protein